MGSDACDGVQSPESEFNLEQSIKRSKIPVLRPKNVVGSNLSNSFANHDDSNSNDKSKPIDISSLTSSPMYKKKDRSQVSNQCRQLERSTGSVNGVSLNEDSISANFNLSEDTNSVNMDLKTDQKMDQKTYDISWKTSYDSETLISSRTVNDLQNETNSGRSTPTSINTKSPVINSLNSERKPKFKWMFGPHRNANVVSFLNHDNGYLNFYYFIKRYIILDASQGEEKSRLGIQYRWWCCRS